MGRLFGKSSNDNQENSKDAQEKDNLTKANTELTEKTLTKEKTELTDKNQKLTDKNKELENQVGSLKGRVNSLEQSLQVLENEKAELTNKINGLSTENQKLTTEKTELTDKNKTLTTEKENLTKANTELKTDKENLTKEKENLTTELSKTKDQLSQAKKEKEELEQKHAPYKKLDKLYEVFLEVKGCLNFNFVEKTHSAVELIAYVLSDSKYYVESLYKKASQELSDKRSDKGEKLAELFDLLFEHVKDSKFERLKEPSAYDSTCQRLYPEQNTSKKMQRVVLIGYTYDKKASYHTIVDMGS